MISFNPLKYFRFAVRIMYYSWRVRKRTELSLLRQAQEVNRLRRINRLEPYEYYSTYELWDPRYSWEQKKEYMSRNQYYRMYINLNPPKETSVFNKFVFNVYARDAGLPVAKDYGLFHPHFGRTLDNRDLKTFQQLETLIKNQLPDEFVLKPIGADKGRGLLICEKLPNGKFRINQREDITFEELYKRIKHSHHNGNLHIIDTYLIQEKVRQHPFFDRYAISCTQSLRFITYTNKTGEIEILATKLKIGIGGQHGDNIGDILMMARINQEGILSYGVQSSQSGLHYFDEHPETGARITGEKVPGFHKARELALHAQRFIPQMRTVGWDIAITPEGPVILEGNNFWGWESLQKGSGEGLLKGEFAQEVYELMRTGKSN